MLVFEPEVVFGLGLGVKFVTGIVPELFDGVKEGFTVLLGVAVDLGDPTGVDLLELDELGDFAGDPFPLAPWLFPRPAP